MIFFGGLQGVNTYIVGGDGAGRIAGDYLDLHVNLGVQILMFGLESGTGGLVEGELEELAIFGYLCSVAAPCKIDVGREIG